MPFRLFIEVFSDRIYLSMHRKRDDHDENDQMIKKNRIDQFKLTPLVQQNNQLSNEKLHSTEVNRIFHSNTPDLVLFVFFFSSHRKSFFQVENVVHVILKSFMQLKRH